MYTIFYCPSVLQPERVREEGDISRVQEFVGYYR
jgi:hypothetical protein